MEKRPKDLLILYYEPERIEVLRAHRVWRSWEIDSAEQFTPPPGKPMFDSLRELSVRPDGSRKAAMILVLSRLHYEVNREHYPSQLQDELDSVLDYDWDENVFHKEASHFSGAPLHFDGTVSVPIFSLPDEIYDKFYTSLGGDHFESFIVVPSSLVYGAILPLPIHKKEQETSEIEIIAHPIDSHRLEIHRFHKNRFLDSLVIPKNPFWMKVLLDSTPSVPDAPSQTMVHFHMVCIDRKCEQDSTREWLIDGLPLKTHTLGAPIIKYWAENLLKQSSIEAFKGSLLLRPWHVPKAVWVAGLLLFFYSFLAFHHVVTHDRLNESYQGLRQETAQLVQQWEEVEQTRTKVTRFQEDLNAMNDFYHKGYPVLDILTLLARITPEDTWLSYIGLGQGQLTLRGHSKSAARYILEISKIEGFKNVHLSSPVTRSTNSENEQFKIVIDFEPAELKKAIDEIGPKSASPL